MTSLAVRLLKSCIYFSDHYVLVGLASLRVLNSTDAVTRPNPRSRRKALAAEHVQILFLYML